MAIYKVRKRNGAIVTFDRKKIENALEKAIAAVDGTDFSHVARMTDRVIDVVTEKSNGKIPDVEAIQDSVEEILIKE